MDDIHTVGVKRGKMSTQSISENDPIEIYQVANGFLVRMPYMITRGDFQPIEASMVFQSFSELSEWLAQHFSHRDTGVKHDA